ncbi:uncharacterized protein LOC131432223 [Malaya genurostris]|uniref:uncharacterized protein LOC131432223 n=1 Tax=Malaya genurostris TaxID=325434 RepID=UPI0026F384A0|nr:uncharacterized protein LOC131432223 [Malaya genurostris]
MARASADRPPWMTKEYFEDVVATKFGLSADKFNISDLIVQAATEAGDNFISKLYRVTVEVRFEDGKTQTLPLIVKALGNFGMAEEMIQMMNVFPKEIEVYSKLIPGFEQLYAAKGIQVTFGPKCWKHSNEPTDILVMEDLNEKQFKMVNRREQLDQTHTKVFLKKLAQFHAGSAMYYELNGKYSDKFKEGMYSERSEPMFAEHSKTQMETVTKVVRTWPNGDFYADLMVDGGVSMFRELLNVTRPSANGFNVLNHGDTWCNNMMFRYNADNSIDELILIDFQMGLWSSPVIDLLYFIFSSVRGEDRFLHLDGMISFYHQHLIENLELLGYSKRVPTLKELHLEFNDRIIYGYATSMGLLPICLMEKNENASIDTLLSAGEAGQMFREKMYGNPAFVKQMKDILPYMLDHGAFDVRHCGYQSPSGIVSDFLTLPGWLRKEFFGEVVEKKLQLQRDQFSIRQVSVEIATQKGDNYGSVMYRAKLEVDNKVMSSVDTFSVVVKTRPTGLADDFCQQLNPFDKEIEMYTRIIPAFEELYEKKGLSVELGPRCLKVCKSIPNDIIVMEDLRSINYRVANRLDGLDSNQVESILELLAKFHAASAVYAEQHGGYSNLFNEGLFSRGNLPVMEFMFTPAYDACIETLKAHSFAKDCINDLQKLRPVAFSRTLDCLAVDHTGFNVLNHGDFWANNIMFQYENQHILKQSRLIDFQVCFFGSPVLDLNYFLFSSVKPDIKLSKLNYFIRYYHEKLIDNLVLLDYGKWLPTLKQLQFDFYDRLVYGASTIFGVMALCFMDSSDEPSFEVLHQNDEAGRQFRKRMYGNDRYIKAMESLLPFLAKKGVFKPEAEICSFARKQS